MVLNPSSLGDASSSNVKPNPMKLAINTRTDMPASLNRFLGDRFRMTFTNPIIKNIGMLNKLANISSKKTVFIMISPFLLFFVMLKYFRTLLLAQRLFR